MNEFVCFFFVLFWTANTRINWLILWESTTIAKPECMKNWKLPNALITGTDRTLHVAVTYAPHFLTNCVSTHPTGEHPSWTRILELFQNLHFRSSSYGQAKYHEKCAPFSRATVLGQAGLCQRRQCHTAAVWQTSGTFETDNEWLAGDTWLWSHHQLGRKTGLEPRRSHPHLVANF